MIHSTVPVSIQYVSRAALAVLIVGIVATATYPLERALASTVFVLAVCCSTFLAPQRLGVLSWSVGIPLFYVTVLFALPLLTKVLGVDEEPNPHISSALYIASLGILAFAVGVIAARVVTVQRSERTCEVHASTPFVGVLILIGSAAMAWGYFFGYFGLMQVQGNEVESVAGPISSLVFLLTIGHVVAWNVYFRQKRMLFLAILSTILMAAFSVLSNSKEQMLLPFLLIGLSLWGVSGRFPYKVVIVTVLLYVLVAFPFVTALRIIAPFADSRTDIADITLAHFLSMEWLDTDLLQVVVGKALERGALLAYFADIVRQAGESVPLMNGRTLMAGFELMVPRFLYADKPDMNIGHWTGQTFGAVAPWDEATNASPTYMGEFYMNFGIWGVLIGMFFVGNLATLVDRYVIAARWFWTMPIAVYFVRWQESVIGHTIMAFGKTAFILVLLFIVWKYGLRPLLRPHPTLSASSVHRQNAA
jgi:hypothetical protein